MSVVTPGATGGRGGPAGRRDHLQLEQASSDGRHFVFVHGGRNGSHVFDDTWYYDVEDNAWTLLVGPAGAPATTAGGERAGGEDGGGGGGGGDGGGGSGGGAPPPAPQAVDPTDRGTVVGVDGAVRPAPRYGAAGGLHPGGNGTSGGDLALILWGGTDGDHVFGDMWSLSVTERVWMRVAQVGARPPPRAAAAYGARVGVGPTLALTISHGSGAGGALLSDTYVATLAAPTGASWARLAPPVGAYAMWAMHAATKTGSVQTPAGALVVYGGCYAGADAGGPCPSDATWVYGVRATSDTAAPARVDPQAAWHQLPFGPVAAFSPAAAAYLAPGFARDTVVLYGGSTTDPMDGPYRQLVGRPQVDPLELRVLNTASERWTRERILWRGGGRRRRQTPTAAT